MEIKNNEGFPLLAHTRLVGLPFVGSEVAMASLTRVAHKGRSRENTAAIRNENYLNHESNARLQSRIVRLPFTSSFTQLSERDSLP